MAFEIENGVLKKYIEEEGVTEVTIPDSVTTIGDSAFFSCQSLTSITIPNIVTSIGEWAFCDCKSLESITLHDSVTSIGGYAFLNCKNLTSIIIPDSITSIGKMAFSKGIKIIICKGNVKVPLTLKNNWNFHKPEKVLNNFIFADINDRQQYFDDLPDYYKIPLSMFMISAYPQGIYYHDYLKNNAEESGRYLIDEESIDLLYRFLELRFVTKDNIDSLISYAVEHTQNGGSSEPQLILSKYKNDNFSPKSSDTFNKLML